MDLLRKILKWGKRTAIRLVMWLCRVVPIDTHKIMIVSYYGRGFGDNGKAVVLKLYEKRPDMKIVWAVKKGEESSLPKYVQPVRYDSIRYYYELATAKIWIDNARKHRAIMKRKGQYYIQMWHGALGLKRTEGDVAENLSAEYVAYAKHDSEMVDLFLSGCGFFTKVIRRAYWYDGEILECGTPRLDSLICPEDGVSEKVRNTFGIPNDSKIVLYVPTFRANYNIDCYRMDFEAVLNELEKKQGGSWVFCVRLHPNVASKADFIEYSDRVKNATDYPDQYELVAASNLLISDYSSIMFDAAIVGKRAHIFATDIDEYIQDRGFHYQLDELPFPVAENNVQLINNINTFDEARYDRDLKAFLAEQEIFEDGTASHQVVERIERVIDQ